MFITYGFLPVCKPVLYTDFGSYIWILTVCNSNFSCSDLSLIVFVIFLVIVYCQIYMLNIEIQKMSSAS